MTIWINIVVKGWGLQAGSYICDKQCCSQGRNPKDEAKARTHEAEAKALNPRGQGQGQDQGHTFVSSRILEDKACPRGLHHWGVYNHSSRAYYSKRGVQPKYEVQASYGVQSPKMWRSLIMHLAFALSRAELLIYDSMPNVHFSTLSTAKRLYLLVILATNNSLPPVSLYYRPYHN